MPLKQSDKYLKIKKNQKNLDQGARRTGDLSIRSRTRYRLSYGNLKLLRASSQIEWLCFIRKSMLAKSRPRKDILYVPLITQQLAAWAGVGLVN
jgi:hypothetical protein